MSPVPTDQDLGAWLLKCDPTVWPIENLLAKKPPVYDGGWSVHANRISRSMTADDPVVFWISGPTGAQPIPGIWGVGTVLGPIERGEPDKDWTNPKKAGKAEWFVPVYIEFFAQPISRDELKQHPELRDLAVIRFPNGPNPSRITASQWDALQELLPEESPPPPADDQDEGEVVTEEELEEGLAQARAEDRAAVEHAAIAAVIEAYEEDGWEIDDVQRENRGWDLTARRGEETELVEVKGRAAASQLVLLSRNEIRAAAENPNWWLVIVTEALTEPKPHWWDAETVVESSTPMTCVFIGSDDATDQDTAPTAGPT